jgi:hypothetical protein
LPHRLNRVANLVVPLLAIASFATNPPQDLDDIWFLVVEIIGLLLIIGVAWRWRPSECHATREARRSIRAPAVPCRAFTCPDRGRLPQALTGTGT